MLGLALRAGLGSIRRVNLCRIRVWARFRVQDRDRDRVRGCGERQGLGEKIVDDPGIAPALMVCVTLKRYLQTNSAQALKETNWFPRPITRIHAHAQGCHDYV